MTGYIKLFWAEAPEGEPPVILYDGAIEITPIPTGSPFWFPWMPFTPTCCPDIWSWPDRTGGSICWNTRRGLWLKIPPKI